MTSEDSEDPTAKHRSIWLSDNPVDEAIDEYVDYLVRHKAWSVNLGLNQNFIPSIMKEPSDWGFALKSAAVAEALVTQLIRMVLSEDQRATYFPAPGKPQRPLGIETPIRRGREIEYIRVDSSSPISEKLSLCECQEWMEADWIASVRGLTYVRNRFAHDIRFVNARLTRIIAHEIEPHLRSDVFDALAHPYDADARISINTEYNKDTAFSLNKLSKTRPLQKVAIGSIHEILAGYRRHGYSTNNINVLLRSGTLLTLATMAAIIEHTRDGLRSEPNV